MICSFTDHCHSSDESHMINQSSTVKNNPVKKTVNYWQLWMPALYRNYTVCYCVCVTASVKLKFNTVADITVFSC